MTERESDVSLFKLYSREKSACLSRGRSCITSVRRNNKINKATYKRRKSVSAKMDFENREENIYGAEKVYGEQYGSQSSSSTQQQKNIDIESVGQGEHSSNAATQEEGKKVGCCGFLTIEYYQPFFNVTTVEVKKRLFNVFVPNKPEFQNGPKKNPDLWGPFWSLTTVIFLLFASGNLSSYIAGQSTQARFDYVPAAALLIYGIGIGFPILLSLIIKCFGGDTSPIEAICLYGYSMACFAVVAALSAIPFSWLQWILAIYGFLNSTIFIVVNIHSDLSPLPLQKKYGILGLIGVFQIALMLLFKLYFFSVFSEDEKK